MMKNNSSGEMMGESDDTMMEKNDDSMMEEDKGAMKDDSEMMEKDDNMEESDSMMEDKDGAMMKSAGSYETYDESKLSKANDGSVVLFFHAGWCPSCKTLDANINANVTEIPDGVTILKTDYDSNAELKKKYGVTYQHTMVQVDAEGNMIKKWSGGATLLELLSNIEA